MSSGGRAYLDEHGVEVALSNAVKAVLRDRPANPIKAISDLLANLSAATGAGGLEGNKSVLSAAEMAFATSLAEAGQAHLFEKWPAPGKHDAEKKAMIQQILDSDAKYGGGIVQYIKNARKLLADSKAGVDPFAGYSPTIPMGETLTAHTDEWTAAEKLGLETVADCCFMLVAGGLGERLGYNGIKVGLPTETASGRCYLQFYIEHILAYQAFARKARGDASITLPLAIMTSADTDAPTRALLAANGNFGMAEGQVVLLMQGKVPSIEDNDGRIALEASGFQIQTKPHGHGDVHSLLHLSHTVKAWLKQGKKYMFIFQDTNAFALQSCLLGLGVSVQRGFDMNSVCVPRIAGEAIGGICALKSQAAGSPDLTVNVEYNQVDCPPRSYRTRTARTPSCRTDARSPPPTASHRLPPPLTDARGPLLRRPQIDTMLRATEQFKDGDVNDPVTGFSIWPGSINELIFKLDSYDAALEDSKGAVPEFVNPKYKDATKTSFKSPTRLECMMQDFPRLYTRGEKVGFTSLNRKYVRQYSPVKNNVKDAKAKQESGLEPACASAGEIDVYKFNADILSCGGAGMAIGAPVAADFLGIKVSIPPAVVLSPSFAVGCKGRVSGGSLAPGSTLILEGEDITLKNVHVDGCLVVKAPPGQPIVLENLNVKNAGCQFVPLTEDELATAPEPIAIRGFRVQRKEAKTYSTAGTYTGDVTCD